MEYLLSEKEAAARLGLKPTTLRWWRAHDKGPPFKRVGAAIRYAPDELDAWVVSERPGEGVAK